MRSIHIATAGVIAGLLVCGCDDGTGAGNATRVAGGSVNVGDGRAESWVESIAGGTPIAIGVTLNAAAFEHLPAVPTEFDLPLPSGTPFNHIGLDWNPNGHEPLHIYDLPHFDVHFYRLTPAERNAITSASPGLYTPPDPDEVPSGYIDGHAGVPRMGNHWVDGTAPEFQPGGVFTHTFIYGYFNGDLAFVEPMIAASYWQSGARFSTPVRLPLRVEPHGVAAAGYPSRYRLTHTPGTDAYSLIIDEFVDIPPATGAP